jgi:hypothetical protein
MVTQYSYKLLYKLFFLLSDAVVCEQNGATTLSIMTFIFNVLSEGVKDSQHNSTHCQVSLSRA